MHRILKFKYHISFILAFVGYCLNAIAATYTISNTNDAGAGSLRQAITDANAAGNGPHTFTMTTTGTIVLASDLPTVTVSDITFDAQNKLVIQGTAAGGDVGRYIISIGAGGNNTTLKNFIIQNTGVAAIRATGVISGLTIDNVDATQVGASAGNYLDYYFYTASAIDDVTITNSTIEYVQDGLYGFYFGSTTDIIHITDVNILEGPGAGGFGLRFVGAADSIVIENTVLDFDDEGSTDDGDYGIYFDNTADNVWIDNLDIHNVEIYGINVQGVVTDFNITNSTIINEDGYAGAMGIRFATTVTNIDIDNLLIDMDLTTSTDDGDYGIYFVGATNNVTINDATLNDCEVYSLFFGGAASTVSITNSSTSNENGWTAHQAIRFNSTVANLVMTSDTVNVDLYNSTDEGDYGILFIGAVTTASLSALYVNKADYDAIYVASTATSFTLVNSTLTNDQNAIENGDGIEFTGVAHTNILIDGCTFDGLERTAMYIDVANATNSITISDNTIKNIGSTTSHRGIWLASTGGNKDIVISGNTIYDCGGAAIYNEQADDVLYTQNSIYSNGSAGIDNVADNGNCDYELADGDVPTLISSSKSGNDYTVVFTLPAICAGGCNVEFFANDYTDIRDQGRQYAYTGTALTNASTHTITITCSTGECADTRQGFWTSHLTVTSTGCTSEFSNPLSMNNLKGPACVTSDLLAWLAADQAASGTDFYDISGNGNGAIGASYTLSDPDVSTGYLINYNPAFYYDGNDMHSLPAGAGVTTDYTIIGIAQMEGTTSGRVFSSSQGNKLFGYWGADEDELYVEGWLHNPGTTASTDVKLYSYEKTASTNNWLFKGNGSQIATNTTATNDTEWRLTIAGYGGGGEYSTVYVPEAMVFDADLTAADMLKIESYLAIKYGITLPDDYQNSSGTVIWDQSANSSYHYDVAGIGRQDCTNLNQKQSKTSNSDSDLIVGMGTISTSNALNTGSFTADGDYLIWGNNNSTGTVAVVASTNAPASATATYVLNREWMCVEVGTDATDYDVAFKVPSNATGFEMYLDEDGDGDMSDATRITGGILQNNWVTFQGVDLDNNDVFTVAYSVSYPAGVSANLALWLRPESAPVGNMVNGTGWNDESGNGNHFTTVVSDPAVVVGSSGLNFNKYVAFDGGDLLSRASISSGYSEAELFAVPKATASAGALGFVTHFGGVEYDWYNYTTDDNYFSFGTTDRIGWDWSAGTIVDAHAGLATDVTKAFDPEDWNVVNIYAESNNWGLANNGYVSASTATNTTNFAGATNYIGNGEGGYFTGYSGDVILYSQVLSAADRSKINTYLAIKYGIHLETDYVNNAGTTIWDETANAAYHYDVAGIGYEQGGGLLQRQSKSVNSDAMLTIGIGQIASDNASNTYSFTASGDYLIWGNNNATTDLSATNPGVNAPATAAVSYVMTRYWKIEEVGTDYTNYAVKFDIPSSATAVELYIDEDGDADFSDATRVTGGTISGSAVTFTGIDLDDGDIITIGYTSYAPGGVVNDLRVWLKANAGVTQSIEVSAWVNQADPGGTFSQSTEADKPIYVSSATNYNPGLEFRGGQSIYNTAINNSLVSSTDPWMYAYVAEVNDNASGNRETIYEAFADEPSIEIYSGNPGIVTTFDEHHATDLTSNRPAIVSGWWNNTSAGGGLIRTYIDGGNVQSDVTNNQENSDTDQIFIGANDAAGSGQPLSGTIFEFSLWNADQRSNLDKIESYLAIKYGITLENSGGGTEGDYLSSEGTTLWDASANSAYHQNVIGIGRDDASGLYQRQSHIFDDSVRLYISTLASTNSANAGTFSEEISYVIMGDNNESLFHTSDVESELPSGIYSRLAREFLVTRTNNADDFNVDITLNDSASPASVTTSHLRLLVDTDGDFTNATAYADGDNGLSFSYTQPVVSVSGISTSHIPNNGSRFFTLGSVSMLTPLPIQLLSFNAKPINNKYINLTWSTATEINNDYFTIQRSKDAIRWEDVTVVAGAGNATSTLYYEANDNEPYSGVSYYRLKQTDYDNRFTYSAVKTVTIKTQINDLIKVYPNPASSKITVEGPEDEITNLYIIDMVGKDLGAMVSVVYQSATHCEIDLQQISSGIYLLRTVSNSVKIVKH